MLPQFTYLRTTDSLLASHNSSTEADSRTAVQPTVLCIVCPDAFHHSRPTSSHCPTQESTPLTIHRPEYFPSVYSKVVCHDRRSSIILPCHFSNSGLITRPTRAPILPFVFAQAHNAFLTIVVHAHPLVQSRMTRPTGASSSATPPVPC